MDYGRLANIYDACAAVGSLGGIPLLRRIQLNDIHEGQSVLYLGAGTAQEGIAAAQKGAHVTILDISERMIAAANRRAERHGVRGAITFVCTSVFSYTPECVYDVVVANFFMDIFSLTTLSELMPRMQSLMSPSGKLMVIDLSCPRGSLLVRAMQHTYHLGAAVSCALLANQPWLQIHDYRKIISESGMHIQKERTLGHRWLGDDWYFYVVATRIAESIGYIS